MLLYSIKYGRKYLHDMEFVEKPKKQRNYRGWCTTPRYVNEKYKPILSDIPKGFTGMHVLQKLDLLFDCIRWNTKKYPPKRIVIEKCEKLNYASQKLSEVEDEN